MHGELARDHREKVGDIRHPVLFWITIFRRRMLLRLGGNKDPKPMRGSP